MYRKLLHPAEAALMRAAASTSMKPGRVKRKIREDWFTLLFEVTRVRPTALVKVIRGLI